MLEDRTSSAEARRQAEALIWQGNVQLLEHEQRALVQPNLDRLSCAFARLFSIGSALTFEVRGVRQEAMYFTSFYLYALTRGIPQAVHAHTWPRITRYDDRWGWIATSIVPRFQRFDADTRWPRPVCTASSPKRATTRRTPASYRADRLSMARKWSSNAWASAATPRRIRAPRGSTTVRPASSPLCTTVSRVGS